MSDFSDATPIATPEQYRAALLAIRQRMTDIQLKLLQAHCRSDGHSTSTDRLAEALGMSTPSSAKTTYNNYAHWMADELKYAPAASNAKKPMWMHALAHGRPDTKETVDGKYVWIMRPELVEGAPGDEMGLIPGCLTSFHVAFGFPAYHTESIADEVGLYDRRRTVLDALAALDWAILEVADDTISASIGCNLWSWGERVTIRFRRDGSLSITSQCAMPTQCIDWGKNQENVVHLIAELRKAFRLDSLTEQTTGNDRRRDSGSHQIQEGADGKA